MGVGGSSVWISDRGIGYGVGSVDGIIYFFIDDGSYLSFSDFLFEVLNNGNCLGLFLYEWLE